jgi:hypothetical protein
MLGKIWDWLFGYLKGRSWWPRVEPYVMVLLGGGAAQVFASEYVAEQYGVHQPLRQFLSSYFSLRITVVTAGVVLLVALLARERPAEPASRRRNSWYRLAGIVTIAFVVGGGFLLTSTRRAHQITVRIGSLPDRTRADALTYIVYELNRIQRDWYFQIDFRQFEERELTTVDRKRCDGDPQPLLCHAQMMAGADGPTILITSAPLANDVYFATHQGRASVISTAEAASYLPLTVYEFLAYNLIVQSIVLHLDESGDLPALAYEKTAVSRGGVFQYVPGRDSLRPTMLAARLSPTEEMLLFNRFGPAYLGTCEKLLTLDWLYAPGVRSNLQKVFDVPLTR